MAEAKSRFDSEIGDTGEDTTKGARLCEPQHSGEKGGLGFVKGSVIRVRGVSPCYHGFWLRLEYW
jgi:hypothetical protein